MQYKTLSAPVAVQIELTYSCNHRCLHCYNPLQHSQRQAVAYLEQSHLDLIISELIRCKVVRAAITGGEPLLRKAEVLYLAAALQQAGLGCSLNTNAMLIDRKLAQELSGLGVSESMVSLYGDSAQLRDSFTGTPGSWKRALSGMQTLSEAGILVTANMVVTSANAGVVKETGLVAQAAGVRYFRANKVCPPQEDLTVRTIELPTAQQVRESLDALLELEDVYGLESGVSIPYPWCLLQDLERYERFAHRHCSAGLFMAQISPAGVVLACGLAGQSGGNIATLGLDGAWQRLTQMRQRLLPEKCEACRYRLHCAGGCCIEAEHAKFGKITHAALGEEYVVKPPRPKKHRLVEPTTWLKFAPKLRSRAEDFGGLLSNGSETALFPHRTFAILTDLISQAKPFCAALIAKRYQVELTETVAVLSRLISQGVLQASSSPSSGAEDRFPFELRANTSGA